MPSLTKGELAERIVEALASDVVRHGSIDDVPFDLTVRNLLPLAVYAFTVTDPPGGRPDSELKVQLIAPGQERGETGNFEAPNDETFVVLLGYSPHYDVFVLWDAYKHRDFAWSKNCQIRIPPIKDAQITGRGYRERTLAGGVEETIIVARPDHLRAALAERIQTG